MNDLLSAERYSRPETKGRRGHYSRTGLPQEIAAVRDGAKVDLSTVESTRKALLDAKTIT